jgi:C1A family cysteine protease
MSDTLSKHLGVPNDRIRQAVERATRALPDNVAATLSRPVDTPFSLGAMLEPTKETKAAASSFMKAAAARIALPSSVSHAGSMAPIQDQGQRGTCVAFGSTALHEFASMTPAGRLKFSEQFVYEEIKRIDGHPNDCGTWLVYAIQVFSKLGQCLESDWSYNPNLPCNHNGTEPANARAKAAAHKVQGQMLNPKDVIGIKTELASMSNVAFCIPVYNSWYRSAETARTGRITMRIGNEPAAGGHCMCLIGYQDDAASPGGGYFILRNSWGTHSWGYQCPYGAGNGTIPYQYIVNDATEAAAMLQQRGVARRRTRAARPKAKPASRSRRGRREQRGFDQVPSGFLSRVAPR